MERWREKMQCVFMCVCVFGRVGGGGRCKYKIMCVRAYISFVILTPPATRFDTP
jgi:hypothetical protein